MYIRSQTKIFCVKIKFQRNQLSSVISVTYQTHLKQIIDSSDCRKRRKHSTSAFEFRQVGICKIKFLKLQLPMSAMVMIAGRMKTRLGKLCLNGEFPLRSTIFLKYFCKNHWWDEILLTPQDMENKSTCEKRNSPWTGGRLDSILSIGDELEFSEIVKNLSFLSYSQ